MARGGFNNVSEVLGRRERRPPTRYDEYQQWSDSPPRAKASRGRGNMAGQVVAVFIQIGDGLRGSIATIDRLIVISIVKE